MPADVTIGVLRLVLHVPGARSLKDGRQVLHSVRDRVRHTFEVAVSEVDPSEIASRRVLVITTAGNDARLIRSILHRIRAFVESMPNLVVAQVDVDVFSWHPPEDRWFADPSADEE
jgi:hypothetical protein